MENNVYLTIDRLKPRNSTDLSFRSSQCSMQDMNGEDFYEVCKSTIKVCEKNSNLLMRIRYFFI